MITDALEIPWSEAGPGIMAELVDRRGHRVRLYAQLRADGLAQWLARNRTTGVTDRGVVSGMPRAIQVAGEFALQSWGELDQDLDRFDQLMRRASAVVPA